MSAVALRAHQATVAQHRHPVGDLEDLVEKMRDEDDAKAALLERAHDIEHQFDLLAVEAGGRLIEDEHLSRQVDRAGNRDHLLHRDRIAFETARDIDVEAKLRQHLAGAPVHRAARYQAEPRRLVPEAEVFRHRKIGQQIDLLVHRPDAVTLGVDRAFGIDDLAIEQDVAAIAPIGAGQAFDEC
jgi:hypothetical protein